MTSSNKAAGVPRSKPRYSEGLKASATKLIPPNNKQPYKALRSNFGKGFIMFVVFMPVSCRCQSSLKLFRCGMQEGSGRLSRGAAGTRPNRRNPSRKLPSLRQSNLVPRNEAPSSCQSRLAPELIWKRSRRAFGTTVSRLLFTVPVMVRISFTHPLLASQKERA